MLPIKAIQCVRYPPTPLAGGQKTSAGTLLFNQDFLAPALTLFQTHPRPLSAFASATADKQGGEPLRPNPCPSPSAFCLLPCVLRPASCVFLSPTLPFSHSFFPCVMRPASCALLPPPATFIPNLFRRRKIDLYLLPLLKQQLNGYCQERKYHYISSLEETC